MFLKVFKEKSNQKFIESALSHRKVDVNKGKIDSVGVLLNNSEFSDYSKIETFLQKEIGVKPNRCSFITFSEDWQNNISQWNATFTSKDFGWKGSLKNQDLIDFTKSKFDVLICYFLANHNELKQIAAMTQANLKVGLSNEDERVYDLIIEVAPKEFSIFKTELKKYLTILNKI
ncbi:MAG: hypothetical protein HKP48_04755 [Winogradskyella sp.]|uniref:DUF6913 domain-containing protein n=1 Tax=Winogradskyella sp. TaxID=1883156 RepID=UPI0017A72A93|nr:hypothetical protein [Winogradskyella sp.]MBT8245837.1 hypothetical protein [Winogradskyella sp.]NNK22608.1 hypothetical protein [Winogradskyella sp.]